MTATRWTPQLIFALVVPLTLVPLLFLLYPRSCVPTVAVYGTVLATLVALIYALVLAFRWQAPRLSEDPPRPPANAPDAALVALNYPPSVVSRMLTPRPAENLHSPAPPPVSADARFPFLVGLGYAALTCLVCAVCTIWLSGALVYTDNNTGQALVVVVDGAVLGTVEHGATRWDAWPVGEHEVVVRDLAGQELDRLRVNVADWRGCATLNLVGVYGPNVRSAYMLNLLGAGMYLTGELHPPTWTFRAPPGELPGNRATRVRVDAPPGPESPTSAVWVDAVADAPLFLKPLTYVSSYTGPVRYFIRAFEKGDAENSAAATRRGTAALEEKNLDKALKEFTLAIRLNPEKAECYALRAMVYGDRGELDKGHADAAEAIRLDGVGTSARTGMPYLARGMLHARQGNFPLALADYTRAIAQVSTRETGAASAMYADRGAVYEELGEFDKALKDYATAIQVDAQKPNGHNNLAWIRATCPKAEYRDGAQAVASARKACELSFWKDGVYLDTFAAALAEAGNYPEAIRRAREALDRGLPTPAETEKARLRLKLYEEGKPYRR